MPSHDLIWPTLKVASGIPERRKLSHTCLQTQTAPQKFISTAKNSTYTRLYQIFMQSIFIFVLDTYVLSSFSSSSSFSLLLHLLHPLHLQERKCSSEHKITLKSQRILNETQNHLDYLETLLSQQNFMD